MEWPRIELAPPRWHFPEMYLGTRKSPLPFGNRPESAHLHQHPITKSTGKWCGGGMHSTECPLILHWNDQQKMLACLAEIQNGRLLHRKLHNSMTTLISSLWKDGLFSFSFFLLQTVMSTQTSSRQLNFYIAAMK